MRTLYCLIAILLSFFWTKDDLRASHRVKPDEASPVLVTDLSFFDMHRFADTGCLYSANEHQLAHTLSTHAATEYDNRCQFPKWDHEDQARYISDWLFYLNSIKEEYGYIPGVAQITMGELDLIFDAEQKKPFQQLLDKPICADSKDKCNLLVFLIMTLTLL